MSKTINLGPVSAYALAKKHGFVGTEAEWLKSLGAHIGGNGNWWVGNEDLGVLADPAELSKLTQQAQAAQTAAEGAADAAVESAEAAQRSASNAASAASAAAANARAAKTAQEAAAKSASTAFNSAAAAQTSAEAASQSANAAAGSATTAQNAQTAAEAAQSAADADAAATAEARKIVESAADAETARVEAEKARAAKDAERDGKINMIADGLGALRARENVLTGSASGTVVSAEDAAAVPLCGLHIYGKSVQDGTPSPDNPVPIVSVGDGGDVLVTLSDGNRKEQTLTLQTPTGLPGIPVTSGGNYTDANGQKWITDEINFEKGVKIQNIGAVDLSELRIVTTAVIGSMKRIALGLPLPAQAYSVRSLCNRLTHKGSYSDDSPHFYTDGANAYIFIPVSAENPSKGEYTIIYALASPTEVPLTDAEIAAYKALTTYAPTTIVQASDDADIKLYYQRDVNLVVKNLEDAIASMTTT